MQYLRTAVLDKNVHDQLCTFDSDSGFFLLIYPHSKRERFNSNPSKYHKMRNIQILLREITTVFGFSFFRKTFPE